MSQLLNYTKSRINNKQTTPYKSSAAYAAEKGATALGIRALMSAAGKPDIMLGILPVYQVQSYEVGRSMEVLKFRAAKGQFFKQQEGHDVSLRIDLVLTGPYRELYLSFIETVYVHGNSQNSTVLHRTATNISQSVLNSANILAPGFINQSPIMGDFKPMNTKDIGSVLDSEGNATDIDQGDWHNTFTFVSATDVLFDMYIENHVAERSVRGGYNAIYVSLFCVKFYPPDIVKIQTVEEVKNKVDDVNIPTKTYGGQHYNSTTHKQVGAKNFYPRNYTDSAGKKKIHNVPSFFNNTAPDVSATTQNIYTNQYNNTTSMVGQPQSYKPDNSDWIDLTIRAANRIYHTFKRFRERELNFEMTETGVIPWNFGVDLVSTRIPEIDKISIAEIVYKNEDKPVELPEVNVNEGIYK
jgi:hypothetical protein